MRKIKLMIAIFLVLINIASCNTQGALNPDSSSEPSSTLKPSITAEPVMPSVTPAVTDSGFKNQEIQLTVEEEHMLGVLIKWVYNNNIIYSGEDDSSILLPEKLELLSSDIDKMRFVVNVVVFEQIIDARQKDGMTYSFSAEEADRIAYSAVGEKFKEHKPNDYIGSYIDGTYSYSMVGADGATWWPDIEINKVTQITEKECLVEGVLISKHDIYPDIYSFDFEAVVSKNQESIFSGFTLEELSIQ